MPSTRRSFLVACAAGLGSFAGCLSSADPNVDGTWTRRTVDDERTGYAPTDGPTTDLHAVWTRDRPGRSAAKPSPVVDDGVVYFAYSQEAMGDGQGGAWVEAFDAGTGDSLWTTELFRTDEFHYFYHSDSTVVDGDNDRLFVQTKPGLTMLTTDGTVEWTFDNLYRGQQTPDVVPPVVTDDTVVTGTYNSDVDEGQREIVYGIDPATGDERWRTAFPDRDDMWQLSGTDDAVYVPFNGSGLAALETTSGDERWWWDGPINGTVTVLEETLLVPLYHQDRDEPALAALDRNDRSIRWEVPFRSRWADAEATVVGDRVFLMADFGLEARDLETGEQIWRFGGEHDGEEVVGPQFDLRSTPVVAGDAVYAPGHIQRDTMYGHLFVVDAATGDELGRVELGRNENADTATPAITSDLVFLGTSHGNLHAVGECGFDVAGYCLRN
ncbi:outer membrane protein assembly factor BamB family protein [Halopiger aswanensis]|uniref:Outer membrane protein assembly factor BamB n=1 Tax=Halopiger aswanensis TaxID=148449 RepID=A0A419WQJ8_9EURY|nr:PQQ-binding-like beta-propeller repeat protein [Halopiger aswanensis]RKD97781.1 outer membrane protein assembly factor BamB [Halopiger aswanensis]